MQITRLFGPQFSETVRGPFIPFWLGQSISTLGDRITAVTLPALVLALGGGAIDLARLAAWYTVPELLFLLVGGVLSDRVSKRTMMLVTDLIRAALLGLAAFLFVKGDLDLGLLTVLYLAQGACAALFMPAAMGVLPEIVPTPRLLTANALRNSAVQLAGILGPALGGLLVAAGGVGLALGLDAASFLVGALGLLLMGQTRLSRKDAPEAVPDQVEAAPPASMFRELAVGFKIVASRPWLWQTVVVFAFINIFFAGLNAIFLPLFARNALGDTTSLGWLYTFEAVGALLASAVLARIETVPRRGWVAYATTFTLGGAIVMLSMSTQLWLAALAMALSGMSVATFAIVWESTLQERVPEEALGRVASVDLFGSIGLLPLGFLALGLLGEHLSPAHALQICAGAIAALGILALCSRSIRSL